MKARVPAFVLSIALALPQIGAAQQGERYVPGVWIDPDGCEHWVMDDGAASGIGGGSADAAAAWRGMICLNDKAFDTFAQASDAHFKTHLEALTRLGADVPMCIACKPMRARGVGDLLEVVPLPTLYAVLVNPRLPVSTPSVFKALSSKTNPPMPDRLPAFADAAALIDWLGGMRNDLEPAALAVQPAIADVLDVLADQKGCGLARMSGSGATCFGVFDTEASAKDAARKLYHAHPDWWVAGCVQGFCVLRIKTRKLHALYLVGIAH